MTKFYIGGGQWVPPEQLDHFTLEIYFKRLSGEVKRGNKGSKTPLREIEDEIRLRMNLV